MMDIQKTLLISEQDEAIWKEIEELTGQSISATVTELLSAKLEQLKESKKAREGQYSRIEVSYKDDEGFNRKKAFVGRWLLQDYSEAGVTLSVALTQKERLFVQIENHQGGATFVFDTLIIYGLSGFFKDNSLLFIKSSAL